MFRSSTVIRELVLSLAKVISKHSVKLCPYRLCGSVAACLVVTCVGCAVQNETAQHTTHTDPYNTLCGQIVEFLSEKPDGL
jgi:hypothetical protein